MCLWAALMYLALLHRESFCDRSIRVVIGILLWEKWRWRCLRCLSKARGSCYNKPFHACILRDGDFSELCCSVSLRGVAPAKQSADAACNFSHEIQIKIMLNVDSGLSAARLCWLQLCCHCNGNLEGGSKLTRHFICYAHLHDSEADCWSDCAHICSLALGTDTFVRRRRTIWIQFGSESSHFRDSAFTVSNGKALRRRARTFSSWLKLHNPVRLRSFRSPSWSGLLNAHTEI